VPQSVVLEERAFVELLEREHVTVLWITIGLLNQYVESLLPLFPRLRYVITGGDVVDPALVRKIMRQGAPQNLLNAYGPTECTTFSTTHKIEVGDEETGSVPIGKPIANARIYILSRHLQPVPIGATGEIYIGGEGVALGYLNRPELNSQRFISDPFDRGSVAPIYRTGDLGRWRPDGAIEFVGRNDTQVKIRGYRVELGEIEARLSSYQDIEESVVLAREDVPGRKRLVAYLIPKKRAVLDVESLRVHLGRLLPDHMVPAAFVTLDRWPLTANGKLDRRALPAPEAGAYANRPYEAPTGDIEELLAQVWQDVLGVRRVGRRDNFFELGGHSILAMQVMTRLRSRLSIEIPMKLLFQFPTLEPFAVKIEERRQASLVDDITQGTNDMEALLERVAAMPEDEARELVRQMRMRATP
jgi:acyl-CoA synthetase (AMP-forming)/AMP-acid ligase II/acyl carrier protein